MIHKMFIVAKGNTAAYQSLQNTVGAEPDVVIMYDRRSLARRERHEERRAQPAVDEEIKSRGWAVVRDENVEPLRNEAFAMSRYNKLREIWRMPNPVSPER